MNQLLHVYLLHCSYTSGETWAIVVAPNPKLANEVYYSQTKYPNAEILDCKELKYFGNKMQIVYEGGNREIFEKYTSWLQGEFEGSFDAMIEEIKRQSKGDKGDKGDPGTPADTTQFPTRTELESAIATLRNALATVATSGSYSDLIGKPTIPTKTSDLNNDSLPSMETLASYLTIESFQDQMSDILGLSAEGIQELVRILNDEDTTTGILEEIAGKATKTEVENAKVEAIKSTFPIFENSYSYEVEDGHMSEGYPDDAIYADAYIVYVEDNGCFGLYDPNNDHYYLHWKAFSIFADCHAYNVYEDNDITAKCGMIYHNNDERIYTWDGVYGLQQLRMNADWNYLRNKPDLNAIYPSFLPVTSVISTSPSNVRTTNGGDAQELIYSTATKQVYNKIGSYLYTQWNGKVVNNIYYYPHQAYRTTTSNTTNAAKLNVWFYSIGTTYVYRNNVKYDLANLNTSFATVATSGSYNDLSDKPTIPAAPNIIDFSENSFYRRSVWADGDDIGHKHYFFADLEEEGITGDHKFYLDWTIGEMYSSNYGSQYQFSGSIVAPEAIIELHTAPNSNTRISIADLNDIPVKWITPAIGVLDADSYYLISIVDGTAGIVKLEERTYA